jgi:lysophospholipase L1-like esterase
MIPEMRRMPLEWVSRALLILAPLVLLELGARFFYRPARIGSGDWHFEYDPDKVYRWRASHKGVFGTESFETNPENRVGKIFTPEKKSARIAVLGDSVSFGFNIPYDRSYVPQLEAQLPAEILNYAVPGYSTFQHYFDLQASMRHCPDLVFLQVQANDLVEPFHYLRRLGGIGIDYHQVPDPSGLHFLFRGQLRLYEFLSDLFVRGAVSGYGKEEMRAILDRDRLFNARTTLEHPELPNSLAAWKEFDFWIAGVGAVCRLQKVPCVALLSPSSFQHYHASPVLSAGMELLRKKIENEGLTVLDPWPVFEKELARERNRGFKDPVKLWNLFFLDDIHPTEHGHELLARYLLPELRAVIEKHGRRNCE